jgi:pimeloyl-ACP methyl ester carboxylesterase
MTQTPLIQIESTMPVSYEGVGLSVEKIAFRSALDGQMDWAVVSPPSKGNTWVVFLHGHGSFGDQLFIRQDIKTQWLPHIQKHGLGILAANTRGNAWMNPAAAHDLAGLIGWLKQTRAADKIVLIGGSMGGSSALCFAGLYPELVDGVVSLCPATDLAGYLPWCDKYASEKPVLGQIAQTIRERYAGGPEANPDVYRKHSAVLNAKKMRMPVTVVQAEGDMTIPVQQARDFAQQLSGRMTFRYLELPGGHHDSALAEFAESLDWVLVRIGR